MNVRADWTLELQLEQTENEAQHDEVKSAVATVLRHMRSGKGRNRKGGQKLISLLEIARLRASEEAEWQVVRLVQDALDYCEGRALRPEFEERFHLFEDGKRHRHNVSYLSRIFWTMSRYTEERGREILANTPEVTAQRLLDELVSLTSDGQFVDAPEDRPGRYRIVRGRAEMALWLERIFGNRIDIEDPQEAVRSAVVSPELAAVLADEDRAEMLLRAAQLKRHAASIGELSRIAEDPNASEFDLHRLLKQNVWIFGGRYVGAAAERRLTAGSELDIPLIRGDGALHVVELKRSMRVRALVKRYRNAWVPTAEVHDAVGQAINYLVSLDEDRYFIRENFGIETRRASALVLIGHPNLHPEIPEEEINDALRTLNAHTSRVEVLTYKDLIDSAGRALKGAG